MFIIFSLLIAVFTAPVNLVVDFLFCDIISAPTRGSENLTVTKDSRLARVGKHVSRAVRRASLAAMNGLVVAGKALRERYSVKVMRLSSQTVEAHGLATACAESVLEHALVLNSEVERGMQTLRDKACGLDLQGDKYRDSSGLCGTGAGVGAGSESGSEGGSGTMTRSVSSKLDMSDVNEQAELRYRALCEDVYIQRGQLHTLERLEFDSCWGYAHVHAVTVIA